MERESGPADDRWQQLIGAFDPERNLRAISDLWQQAASGSEQVLGSVMGNGADAAARHNGNGSGHGNGSGPPPADAAFRGASLLRDAFAEMERSFGRLYNAMGSMMVEGPLRSAAFSEAAAATEIVVIDGVGTTSITVPAAPATPHCGGLRSHDGCVIDADAVRVLASNSFDTTEPTFVVRVDVDSATPAGAYHGQLLVGGLPDFTLPLVVRVVDPDGSE